MADREPDDRDGAGAEPVEPAAEAATDPDTRRQAVETKYDFDSFGPADMAEMTVEEWEAAFDADTWITGEELLKRVAAELRSRVAAGELFAVVERHTVDGNPQLLVYTDAEYVVVASDGTVEGEGTIRRAVEPVVALCSMEDFEVETPPEGAGLPDPESVRSGSGDLGHRLLLAVALIQVLAGIALIVSPLFVRLGPGAGPLTTVIGLIFVLVGVLLGVLVANARLSDRFRAAEFRARLEGAGVGSADRPSFLPPMDGTGEASEPAESEGR